MRPRQPQSLPHLWLFTDERVPDDALMAAIARLPKASGIVFRYHGLAQDRRDAQFDWVRALAKRRGLVLLAAGRVVSGDVDGIHISARRLPRRNSIHGRGLRSLSAHNWHEINVANRIGADLIFLSPVFPTRSHPGAHSLGPLRFAALARLARCPVVALGGMNAARFRRLKPLGAYGWAAIDALVRV